MKCISVSDFVSERCRVEDITYWLHTFRNGMNRISGQRITVTPNKIIVTDLSWALIHSSLLVFGHTAIDMYLEEVYQFLVRQVDRRGSCILFLCSSHCIARLSKTVTGFKNAEEKHLFLSSFGSLLTATNMKEAVQIWKAMVLLFNNKCFHLAVRNAFYTLSDGDFDTRIITASEDFSVAAFEEIIDDEGLSKLSPFRSFFTKILEENTTFSMAGTQNPHYNPDAIQLLCRQWLPLFGLWSAAALTGTGYHYLTNAKVESFFS